VRQSIDGASRGGYRAVTYEPALEPGRHRDCVEDDVRYKKKKKKNESDSAIIDEGM
jgi:hypothetical protein